MDLPQLIKVIDQLSDALAPIPKKFDEVLAKLPRIVAIGAQSAGKSSVLERFVGRDLLPRGTELITRCPLELRLNHCPLGDPRRAQQADGKIVNNEEDWAVFGHKPTERFTSFQQVYAEIQRHMDQREDTRNKRISDVPIMLEIFSKDAVTLSLVDLPGIARDVPSDQENIEQLIKQMIMHYIENTNSIILAVVEANTDLANADVIKMVRELDPRGERSVIVLTKLDAMLAGTDARAIFEGKHDLLRKFPRHKIIGLVNRSPKDMQESKSMADCCVAEEYFFAENYPQFASRNGINYLKEHLNQLLMDKIQQCIPHLKNDILNEKEKLRNDLQTLDEPVADMSRALTSYIEQFAEAYKQNLDGIVPANREQLELIGGAKIAHIFHDIYANALESLDSKEGLTVEIVLNIVLNAGGYETPLYMSDKVLKPIVCDQIQCLEQPSMDCVEDVHRVLLELVHRCMPKDVTTRFPNLHAKINEIASTLLSVRKGPTINIVKQFMAFQKAYVNILHPEYQDKWYFIEHGQEEPQSTNANNEAAPTGSKLFFWSKIVSKGQHWMAKIGGTATAAQQTKSNLQQMEMDVVEKCEMICRAVDCYFQIVRKNIQDLVPKAIIETLINHIRTHLKTELEAQLRCLSLEDLLAESEQVMLKRVECQQALKALEEADHVISNVRY